MRFPTATATYSAFRETNKDAAFSLFLRLLPPSVLYLLHLSLSLLTPSKAVAARGS